MLLHTSARVESNRPGRSCLRAVDIVVAARAS